MREAPAYTEYHPKWHRIRTSTYWWLGRRAYLKFILRELSSLAVAFFVVITLLRIRALTQGPEAYAEFEAWLRAPLLIALNVVSFCFVLFHAITWFNLAPKALAVRLGGKRMPDSVIKALNYVVWLAVSGLVGRFLVGG